MSHDGLPWSQEARQAAADVALAPWPPSPLFQNRRCRRSCAGVAMNIRPDIGATHTVGFLLTPNFSMIAFTAAVEVLRLTNYVTGAKAFAWRLYSPDGKAIEASNGVAVSVDGSYADVGPMPEIIVCSGLDVQKYDHGAAHRQAAQARLLRRVDRRRLHRNLYPRQVRPARRASLRHPLGELRFLSARSFRTSRRRRNCSRSTATASPAPAAPPRST